MAGAGVWTSAAGRDMRALLRAGSMAGLDDPQLLARFLGGGPDVAELAFAALVHRHGGLVLRACRDVLADSHAAEDAAQAVFLVLARRAGSIHKADSLACWLFGVSLRVAHRMRLDDARRRVREARGAELAAARHDAPADDFAGLYEELNNLPERYRRPLILCHLEGLTHQQAAEQLGCPARTIHTRLTRGKARLRDRLIRRGLAPATGLLEGSSALAAPAGWVEATAAAAFSANGLTTPSALLARGVLAAMTATKIKAAALVAGLACALLLGSLPITLKRSAHAKPSPIPQKPIPQSEPAKPAQKAASSRAAEITVLDAETGKPIAGAIVDTSTDLQHHMYTTDERGVARIDLSRQKAWRFGADVWADGYVQQRTADADEKTQQGQATQRYEFRLHKGDQTLGGSVRDARGQPIAGVDVALWGYLGEMKDPKELTFKVRARTDEQGRWRCSSLRKMRFVFLYLTHPDYLSDDQHYPRRFGDPADPTATAALKPLQDFSDVQVMEKGVTLRGRVSDEAGAPIAGAEVASMESKNAQSTSTSDVDWVRTGDDGRFLIAQARPGDARVVAKAAGRVADSVRLKDAAGAGEVLIRLKAAKTIVGTIHDGKNRPIEGVSISLGRRGETTALDGQAATDREGHFRWDEAPDGPVAFSASSAGTMGISDAQVTPGSEWIFTLRKALTISGSVRDIATKKRIDRPEVEVGVVDAKTGKVEWRSGRGSASGYEGSLYGSLDAEEPTVYQLRITARGYEPFTSRSINSDEGEAKVDAALARPDGGNISGVVLDPKGKPIAGAEVALAGRSSRDWVQVAAGKLRAWEGDRVVKTDARGRFVIAPAEQLETRTADTIVAVHDQGYSELSFFLFEARPTIQLQPWGRVEGTMKVGPRDAADREVRYHSDRGSTGVLWSGAAKTDARGRFAIDRIPPGDARVAPGLPGFSSGTLISVESGRATSVALGGVGRPIVARVETPQGFDPKADYLENSEFDVESDRPEIPYPKEVAQAAFEVKDAWQRRWYDSPEGREYRQSWVRRVQNKLGPGNTIRLDDLPPGDYQLKLSYSAGPIYGPNRKNDQITFATQKFTIPEIPGGRSDEPFDLGIIRPEPKGK